MEGGKNLFWEKNWANLGKESIGRFKGTTEADLARRPRWGGGALRAFRRVESIFEAVLFESCVGEAAGPMAVASFFVFECWYFWVSFWVSVGGRWGPKGSTWGR